MSKGNSSSIDFDSLAAASEYATDIGAELGREQIELGYAQLQAATDVYGRQLAIASRVSDAQIATMEETRRQARQYFDHWNENFRPLEQQMVADAEAYNTEAHREQMAAQASADVSLAHTRTREANERAMRSMGIDPRSGRFAAMQQQSGVAQAAQRATAMNTTRRQAEQLGWARRLDATGVGRGMPGASAAAYGAGTNAGVAAGNVMNQAGGTYLSGLSMGAQTVGQGASTVMQGASLGIQGYSSLVGSQTSRANALTAANAEMMGAAIGAAGSAI